MQGYRNIYAQAIEDPSGNHEGGAAPLDAVLKIWHAHACVEDYMAPKDGLVQSGNEDETMETVCRSISESG